MSSRAAEATSVEQFIRIVLKGDLSEEQARKLYALGPEATTLVLLAVSMRNGKSLKRQAADAHLSKPFGQKAPYEKPDKTSTKRKPPGAKVGHAGSRRSRPESVDQHKTVHLLCCPDCGGQLNRCERPRTRIIEDLLEDLRVNATQYTIHRDYCPACKKDVEPVVADAMPNASLGHKLVASSCWFHYGLGVTVGQVIDILAYHLKTKITPGGLLNSWQRIAEVLTSWYEQIGEDARRSSHLHADETGWRVNGATWWLWCFCNDNNCYYMIDRSRGSPALQKFFTEAFDGVLITDFWAAYWSVEAADRQFCLPHLLRDVVGVDQREDSPCWKAFSKRLRRLVKDGIRLSARRREFSAEVYEQRCRRLDKRLVELAEGEYESADARRLAKRMFKHQNHIFTFLDYEDVTFDNNFGERMIRPAVIIRKNSQSNRSARGAASQAILMSIFRTLRLRGLDPIKTIVDAMRTYVATGQLPPLPTRIAADG